MKQQVPKFMTLQIDEKDFGSIRTALLKTRGEVQVSQNLIDRFRLDKKYDKQA